MTQQTRDEFLQKFLIAAASETRRYLISQFKEEMDEPDEAVQIAKNGDTPPLDEVMARVRKLWPKAEELLAAEAALSSSPLPATPTPIRIDPENADTWPGVGADNPHESVVVLAGTEDKCDEEATWNWALCEWTGGCTYTHWVPLPEWREVAK